MIYGYLRVSTKAQNPARQINGLKDHCDKLLVETLSAVANERPIFEMLTKMLECGDTLIVWDLDRAFRSTEDAIIHERQLRQRGVKFQAMNFEIDTLTADGKYAYVVAAAASERERKKTSERTIEGLANARLRGSRLGRPPKMTDDDVRAAISALEAKKANLKELGAQYGVNPWTITRAIRRLIGKENQQKS